MTDRPLQLDVAALQRRICQDWETAILECLKSYIRIPCESPQFDPHWAVNGHIERAIQLLAEWCRAQNLPGLHVEIHRLPGLTPVLLVDVPGERPGCVLLYGHLDKQPPFTGWSAGLAPWAPVVRNGRLYGRGAADDGYATFSALSAITAARAQGAALPRCLLLIEASEESGSIHLPAYLERLEPRLPTLSLIVCLDAECGNYEQLWTTTSLRGHLAATVRVRVLTEGVHSGLATGIAPTPLRILESLLARIENPVTGDLLIESLNVPIPRERLAQITAAARVLGGQVTAKIPFAPGVQPLSDDPVELLVNSTWRPTLAVTGAEGLPPLDAAGNVLLPEIALRLSLRLPPTCDATRAAQALQAVLATDPPYGAAVQVTLAPAMSGWNAPQAAAWLEAAVQQASLSVFGRDALHLGCGGSIPFVPLLGARFERTPIWVTGVLGPQANAHGPNEFLDLAYAQRLTACLALVLAGCASALDGESHGRPAEH